MAGAALHYGPSLNDASNHFTFVKFDKTGAVLIDDKSARVIYQQDLQKDVEPYVYAVVLIRRETVPAATIHGSRIPAGAGCYAWTPRLPVLGKTRRILDSRIPPSPSRPPSPPAIVQAVTDSPVKTPPCSAPASQSSFEALAVDPDSVQRSSPVKAAVAAAAAQSAAAASAPTATVSIVVSDAQAFDQRFKKEWELGQGAFGAVSVRTDLQSGEKVAVKVSRMEGDWHKYACREAGAEAS